MTTIRLFTRYCDSIRLLVLTMVVGLIALSGSALACGPPAPAPSEVGGTATDAASRSQPLPDGSEPINLQQASDDSTPTPLPTICADGIDAKGKAESICGLTIPATGDPDEKLDDVLYSRVEDARRAQSRRGRSASESDARPELHRVWIQLTADTDGSAVVTWLNQHGFGYEDYRDSDEMFAAVPILMIPELGEDRGCLSVAREPIENDPG